MTCITITIPIRTVSEANVCEHWAAKARRAKEQRGLATLMCRNSRDWKWIGLGVHANGATITLHRVGKKEMDSDNLARSFKAVRDGIADALAMDDGDKRLTWRYEQSRGKDYSVQATIAVEDGRR